MKVVKHITVILAVLIIWPVSAHALAVGDKVPDYSFSTLDGDRLSAADISGTNALMMVFWATWCPHCKEEIPGINKLHKEYGPRGLKVVGVNVGINDSQKRVKKYMKKYKIAYPVAYDKGSVVTKSFGVQGTPTVIIIDRKGTMRYRSHALPGDLEKHFDSLMN
jgi:peroxiredoxin